MHTYQLQSGIHTSVLVPARERYTNPQKTHSIKKQQNIDVGLITVTRPGLT